MQSIIIISSVMLWLVVLFNLLITLALVRRINMTDDQHFGIIQAGQNAPNFTAETLKGESVSLSDYSGRLLALVFISPACGHCRNAIQELENLQSKIRRSDRELILVIDADKDKAKVYIQEQNITLPALIAPSESNNFLKDYKVKAVPTYVTLDPHGKIQASGDINDLHWKRLTEEWKKEEDD